MANSLSFVILLFFFWGRSLRFSNLKAHIIVMSCVIASDLGLVAALVFKRNAMEKINGEMPWTLMIHVPIAIFTVVMYLVTAYTGIMLLRGRPMHARMRLLDKILVPARVLTLVTSLMVQFIKV